MAGKVKVAMSWAAACGGCDVSLLDIEEKLLDVAAIAEFVFWPVAMDFKRDAFAALPAKSVDVGMFNGAIRTSEQREDAEMFREKCKLVVAYGTCASFGGIPGLGNLCTHESILDVVYSTTPSTENPDGIRPQVEHAVDGATLTLPAFEEVVHSLSQVVDVDVVLPGCPPAPARVLDLVEMLAAYAEFGSLPEPGTVLASDKGLCDECPRVETRSGRRIDAIVRPHEILADPAVCFVEQGLLCMGIATRGGCGASCIAANMPCRGCTGPTPEQLDPGAEAISAFGSIAGAANENDVPAHQMKSAVRSIKDPVGTFYRFTLPSALVSRAVIDKPEEKGET